MSGYAFLEDYSSLINTIITLHEATLDPTWLSKAIDLTETMISSFYDQKKNTFTDSPKHGEKLIVDPINFYDNATPSGISEAVKALQNMGYEKVSHIEGGFGAISQSKFKIV